MLSLFVAVAVACCLCLSLAAASCQVFKSLGGSQTVVPPRLELGLGSVGPVSLSPSSPGVAFDIDDVFVSFTAQKLCKMQSQQGAETEKETSTSRDCKRKMFLPAMEGYIRYICIDGILRLSTLTNT